MAYEKLSRRALGCMYTAEIIGDVIFIVLIRDREYLLADSKTD